jgi:Tfp pilus assembly protein PilX
MRIGNTSPFKRHRGVALVVVLLLLLVLTLLATTGMSLSTAEWVMAGNEQFHRRASDASAAGIEEAIARLAASAAAQGSEPISMGPVSVGPLGADEYTSTTRYVGDEAALTQSSADKFVGRHHEIESTGTSARNARDVQTQGVMVVSAANGVTSVEQIGTGLLQGGSNP